jgi:hypothetical protein
VTHFGVSDPDFRGVLVLEVSRVAVSEVYELVYEGVVKRSERDFFAVGREPQSGTSTQYFLWNGSISSPALRNLRRTFVNPVGHSVVDNSLVSIAGHSFGFSRWVLQVVDVV